MRAEGVNKTPSKYQANHRVEGLRLGDTWPHFKPLILFCTHIHLCPILISQFYVLSVWQAYHSAKATSLHLPYSGSVTDGYYTVKCFCP